MEYFGQGESLQIYKSLSSCIWPRECRNCGWGYPIELKREVTTKIQQTCGEVEFLKIVSEKVIGLGCTRYCCINNYRPTIPESQSKRLFGEERYTVIRQNVVIENGLVDWLDISWDDDDAEDDISNETNEQVPSIHMLLK